MHLVGGNTMKALVTGWFSYSLCKATAGDLMACDLVYEWLREAGHTVDVALAPPFEGGVDWRAVDPQEYSHLVFVCGPFRDDRIARELLGRFSHCHKTGLNLSMLDPLEQWNPFDFLIERDSNQAVNPDVTMLSQAPKVPVVGLILVHPQHEYKDRGRHKMANQALRRLIASREMAVVTIDTRLDKNSTGLRAASEVESLIAKMDLVLTTRLHGTILSLKNGVPVVAVDAIAGGAKVSSQSQEIGWPMCFGVETVTDEQLQKAFDFCLTPEAKKLARECTVRSQERLASLREKFIAELSAAPVPFYSGQNRTTPRRRRSVAKIRSLLHRWIEPATRLYDWIADRAAGS
jgi:hypothetical protein